MPVSSPLLILMVAAEGLPFGAGKTTIVATIRHVLEGRYGIDTTDDEDRDDSLTASNDPFLAKAKQSEPEGYEEHSFRAHKKLLADALRKAARKLVFVNGDLAKVLPREDFQTSLRQIIAGNFPEQSGQSNIVAIACTCSSEVRRTRIIDRRAERDSKKQYVNNVTDFKHEDDVRKEQYGIPSEHLKKCGIDVHHIDTSKAYPTVDVTLSGKAYKALDYTHPDVKSFIDSIVTALNLDEVMKQLGHASKPRTPSDVGIKVDSAPKSPAPATIRPRSGSSDFKGRPRTMSGANADLEELHIASMIVANQDTQVPPAVLPSSMYKRRNSESDLYRLQRNFTSQAPEDSFIGPMPIPATLAKTLLGEPLEVAGKEFSGVRKDSMDDSSGKDESAPKRSKPTDSEVSYDDITVDPNKANTQEAADSFIFMGTVPIPQSQLATTISQFPTLESLAPTLSEPFIESAPAEERKRRRNNSDSSRSASDTSTASTQETIDSYLKNKESRHKRSRVETRSGITEHERAELIRQARIKRAREAGSVAKTSYPLQPQILHQYLRQDDPSIVPIIPLRRVTSTASIPSCRDESASPRVTRDATTSPPISFDLRNKM